MAWHEISDKPLFEPMMVQYTEVYRDHFVYPPSQWEMTLQCKSGSPCSPIPGWAGPILADSGANIWQPYITWTQDCGRQNVLINWIMLLNLTPWPFGDAVVSLKFDF